MQTITLTGYPSGATLYTFPSSQSLADWTTYRVLLTEGTGADAGRYVGSVDPANGTNLVLFSGATQPASWADAVVGVGWDLLIAAIKADAELGTADGGLVANVGKIPRAATAKADGEAVTRNKVGTATASTLTETLS